MVFRDISESIKSRFPTLSHLEGSLVTCNEVAVLKGTALQERVNWMPIEWIVVILKKMYRNGQINDIHYTKIISVSFIFQPRQPPSLEYENNWRFYGEIETFFEQSAGKLKIWTVLPFYLERTEGLVIIWLVNHLPKIGAEEIFMEIVKQQRFGTDNKKNCVTFWRCPQILVSTRFYKSYIKNSKTCDFYGKIKTFFER